MDKEKKRKEKRKQRLRKRKKWRSFLKFNKIILNKIK